MSFRLKTILGVAAIEAVLLTILIWSGLRYIETSNENEFVQRAEATVQAFAVTTKDAVLASDLASLESFVDEVLNFPGVLYARVLDSDKRVLAAGGDENLLQRDFQSDKTLATVQDNVFDTAAEISEVGVLFGKVEVGLSVAALQEVISDARRYSTLIALIEMALVALFSFILGLYLTRQLGNLTDASKRIAQGEWGYQVDARGKDELATAAKAFNLMSSRIESTYQQVADRERNLRAIMENIQDGILVADMDGKIRDYNPAADSIFGFKADAGPGNLFELAPDEDWASLLHQDDYHWGNLREVDGVRRDNSRFVMELTLTRSMQTEGDTIIAVVRDISARKASEEKLRLRERIVETTQTGVVIADATTPDMPLVYVNPAFEAITGYSAAEALGRNCRFLQGPDTDPQELAEIRAAIEEGRSTQVLLRNYRRDGSNFWNELVITPIHDEAGHLTHFLGLQNDVTARVDDQLKLSENEAHLRGVLDSTHDAIVVTDENGIIDSFNLGAEKMFGYTAPELIGQNVSVLVPSPHKENHDDYMQAYRETGASHVVGQEREYEGINANGSLFPIALRVNEMVKDGKKSFIGVIHDITERKQKEIALQEAKESAEEAAAAKSEFLANMSHEIRTPMHGVLGALEMMRGTPLDRVQQRYLETANSSAEVLLTVIDEILDFSRLEAGQLHIEHLEFDPRKAVEDIIAMLSQRAFEKGLELASYIQPEVAEHVKGDPIRLRQVLINLVGNALKFTEKGEVVVNLTIVDSNQDTSTLLFEVKDTGIGVSRDKQGTLFEAFIQADGSTSRRFGGTGLGLSISRRLVELMGGEIGVDSKEGNGSTFWFRLPVGNVARKERDVPVRDFAGRRILIVDDNATNRIIMHRYLAGWGSSPGSAADGHEALAKMQDSAIGGQPYDLAILDYHMPGMSGVELAQQIRADENLRDTRLIMVSSETYTEQLAATTAVNIWLSKPLRQSDLHDAIATTFGEMTQNKEKENGSKAGVNFNGEHVLLVEDNPISQSLAGEMLRRRGLDVQTAANGIEAVVMATSKDFDVILMDIQMPEMDGYEATARILAWEEEHQRAHTPIIALTAHALPQDRARCLKAGMDDYLVKPYNQESICNIIFRWLSPPSEYNSTGDGGLGTTIFNPAKIQEIRDMMGDKFPELIAQFRETLAEQLERLRIANESNDRDALIEAVHRVKNNAGDLGTQALHQTAAECEWRLEKGDDVPTLIELLHEQGEQVLRVASTLTKGDPT